MVGTDDHNAAHVLLYAGLVDVMGHIYIVDFRPVPVFRTFRLCKTTMDRGIRALKITYHLPCHVTICLTPVLSMTYLASAGRSS